MNATNLVLRFSLYECSISDYSLVFWLTKTMQVNLDETCDSVTLRMSANEQTRSVSGNGNGNGEGIPDDLRCKRSDGKQWRCTAMSMPDKTVCEKHYIQAKKRAANSAFRANQKKVKRRSSLLGETDTYSEGKMDDFEIPVTSIEQHYGNGLASASKNDSIRDKRHDKSLVRYTHETPTMRNHSSRVVAVDLNDDLSGDVGMFEESYRSFRTPPSTALMDTSRNRSSHQSMSPMVHSFAAFQRNFAMVDQTY